jgi:hypothetical protein
MFRQRTVGMMAIEAPPATKAAPILALLPPSCNGSQAVTSAAQYHASPFFPLSSLLGPFSPFIRFRTYNPTGQLIARF